jgi:DNA (cytosine-5)-methyltransferase 1
MTETKKIKILNLYAGIGGNRKLWGGNIEVIAVENNPEIAAIYQSFFPKDKVIIVDAHQYLLEHYKEFDFIWSSPPCPTHGNLRRILVLGDKISACFPDMKLYEEIIFLQSYFKGKWVVENVKSYYEPLIKPQEAGRHYFWANFIIDNFKTLKGKIENKKGNTLIKKEKSLGIKIIDYKGYMGDKRTLINNCIEPELGLFIFDCAFKTKQTQLSSIPPTTKVMGILEATL